MTIRLRLLLAAFINIFIVVCVGYLSLSSTQSLRQDYKHLSQETLPVIKALEEIRFGALSIIAATTEAVMLSALEAEEGELADAEEMEIEQGAVLLRQAIAKYRNLVALYFPEEQAALENLAQEAELMFAISDRFLLAVRTGANEQELLVIKEEMEGIERRFLDMSKEILDDEAAEIADHNAVLESALDFHLLIVVLGGGLIILVSALLAYFNTAYIAGPLHKLKDATKRIAKGDLSTELPEHSSPELGALFASFNSMANSLLEQQSALLNSYEQTENILYVMEDILIATDLRGNIVKFNRSACDQLGYTQEELLGSPIGILLDKNDKQRSLKDLFKSDHSGHVEGRLVNKDGHSLSVLATMSQTLLDSGEASGFLLVATNITDRKLAEDKIHKLAFYDSLTGLPNRTLFYDRLERSIKLARRQEHKLAVLFIDIDNFKQVNDTLGHDVGDTLLRELSEMLGSALRETDLVTLMKHGSNVPTVSRHGGDEFLVLLPHIEDANGIATVVERVQSKINTEIKAGMHNIYTSQSIGIALFPDDGENVQALLQNADTALYAAKAAGKNQFSFFNSEMNSTALRRMDIEKSLRSALAKDQLRLHYQPQLDLVTGQVSGMEALLRWQHPEWGLVSPLEFIPIAESTGLIIPIGEWVLQESCRQWGLWQAKGYDPGKISVNLSASQFKDKQLACKIQSIIEDSQMSPEALVLEITENVLMNDAESTLSQLQAIKKFGVMLAVDDFGTGYSSLGYLKTFPLDYLKIDRCFVRDLESNEKDQELLRTIINMAKNLKLSLVGEGVETPGQLRILHTEGCNTMQGFLLSPALKAEDFEQAFFSLDSPYEGLQLCARSIAVNQSRQSRAD